MAEAALFVLVQIPFGVDVGESVTASVSAVAIAVGMLSPAAGTGMASASLVPEK